MQPSNVIVCEVCETPQRPASRCVECDMPLRLPPGVRPEADPVIVPLPGLELTHADPVFLLEDEPIAGLEPTVEEAVGEVHVDEPPGFEPTLDDPVLDLFAPPPLEALEPTLDTFIPSAPEGADKVPERCPYCGYVHPGRICNNCGRSKTRLLVGNPEALAELLGESLVTCNGCGARVTRRPRCSQCGEVLYF